MTVEGAPHLRAEHLPVFDCANRCGKIGERFLEPMAHVHMMAAAQPFLSGAISKTVNLPRESTIEDVEEIYKEGWKLGLKAVALYRDGSKSSQPLNAKADSKDEDEDETQAEARPEAKALGSGRRSSGAGSGSRRRRPGDTVFRKSEAASRRKRASVGTRYSFAQANTWTARLVRFSSTCTKRARPSAP